MSGRDGDQTRGYTERLQGIADSRWKRLLGAQLPYRMNIRRVAKGRLLDVGCGVGRNLAHLDGRGVGVDTNEFSVAAARQRGLTAYTPEEFSASGDAEPGSYGTILFAHVLEHMTHDQAAELVASYLGYLAADGRVVFIVPQESGYESDDTHVEFVDRAAIEDLASSQGLAIERIYSFPFPRWAGNFFRHNETVALLRGEPGSADAG